MVRHTLSRNRLASLLAATVAVGLAMTLPLGAGPASADGPPSPPPYQKDGFWPPDEDHVLICRDSDGTQLYRGVAWTLEPLIRGPMYAPVVAWLAKAGGAPVVPMDVASDRNDLMWYTADDGAPEKGWVDGYPTRPVGYGPPATDTAPMVSCRTDWYDGNLGTYVVTGVLARALALPTRLIGRTLTFSAEGTVGFHVPRYLFPLTATQVATTLPTPNYRAYDRVPLGASGLTCTKGTTTLYQGAAYTLAPLVRGYHWAPMALWLDGDRVLAPQYGSTTSTGSWATVSGTPVRSGTFRAVHAGRPAGYGGAPTNPTAGVRCAWRTSDTRTVTLTAALASQLGLPSTLVGRSVRITGSSSVSAYTPSWLFPPSS